MFLKAKRNIQVQVKPGKKLRTDIELKLHMRVEEYAGPHNLEDNDKMKQFETLLANAIKADCLELLRIIQEAGSDPLGLEEKVRAKGSVVTTLTPEAQADFQKAMQPMYDQLKPELKEMVKKIQDVK